MENTFNQSGSHVLNGADKPWPGGDRNLVRLFLAGGVAFGLAMLALRFPFHVAFLSLSFLGTLHLVFEYNYWFADRRILRKRSRYRPLIVLGALILMLAFLIELPVGALPAETYGALIGAYLILSVYREGFTVSRKLCLGVLALASAALGAVHPLLLFFLLIHLHNFFPWYFLWKRDPSRVLLLSFALLILVIPGIALSAMAGIPVSDLSLAYELEEALFDHVLPNALTIPGVGRIPLPGLVLLSLFAYYQCLHYALWIFFLGRSYLAPRRTGDFLREVAVVLGFSGRRPNIFFALFPWAVTAASILLFFWIPVAWMKSYYSLAMLHVLLELPLLFIPDDDRPAPADR